MRLQALLDLKRRAEEAAERELAAAVAQRDAALGEQAARDARALVAAQHVRDERQRWSEALGGSGSRASDVLVRQRYVERLADEARRRAQAATSHREAVVARAVAAESAARAGHLDARREREALERVKAKEEAAARRQADRRAEDALGDQALAARARRPKS